jgi:hypothetical protein
MRQIFNALKPGVSAALRRPGYSLPSLRDGTQPSDCAAYATDALAEKNCNLATVRRRPESAS